MSLSFAEKVFFFLTRYIDFSKISHKNVEYFNLVRAHKPKFVLFLRSPVRNFFPCPIPFVSFFSALLLSLHFAFQILSGCRKKLGVIYGQSLEMGP